MLSCHLLFWKGCLNALGLSVYVCEYAHHITHKDVWVKVWEHNDYFTEKYKYGGLPASLLEQRKPVLVCVCHSTSPWLPFLLLLYRASSFFPPLPCSPRRRGVQTVQSAVWSSLWCSGLFLAFFNMGWSLVGTDGISSGFLDRSWDADGHQAVCRLFLISHLFYLNLNFKAVAIF